MRKKLIIISAILLAILAGGWYAYSEYTRKVKSLSRVSADFAVKSDELLTEFETNEAQSNQKYLGKIISVTGRLRSVEDNGSGSYFLILGSENSISSIRCSMDSTVKDGVKKLIAGSIIKVKGACTGYTSDELLGSDIILNRCVIEK